MADAEAARTIRVMTWNLRNDNADDPDNTIRDRTPLIEAMIAREQPDIIGFQEVLTKTQPMLEELLDDYIVVGRPRDAEMRDEVNPVAVRKDRFRILEAMSQWLSPTPEEVGSRYARQSICPRLFTLLLLQEKRSGATFAFMNTHLDHEQPEARRLGQAQLVRRLRKLEKNPHATSLLLVGDFNYTPDDPLYEVMKREGYEDLSAASGGTFHNFGRIPEPMKIDYIWGPAGHWTAAGDARAIRDRVGRTWLSDHFPVAVDLEPVIARDES